jgi:phosphate transport system protein
VPRDDFQAALAGLRSDVGEMGGLVSDQFESGLRALETGDDRLARSVVEADGTVNDRYLDLEADCIDLFALQQPVAGDLRFVAASFKILTDVERVGDLASNLGSYALSAPDDHFSAVDVGALGRVAHEMFDDAMAAYADGDTAACRRIIDRDDDLDTLCLDGSDRIVRDLIEHEAHDASPWDVESVLDDVTTLLLTIRDVERVGDHAANIAARTVYAVEGDTELIY